MAEEFDHDKWVSDMQAKGHMADGAAETPDARAYESGTVSDPVDNTAAVEEALVEGEHSTVAPTAQEGAESVADGNSAVEVKYLGHGAYEAEGVEVKRNGQTLSVDEAKAQALTGLTDGEGNVLFERV